MNIPSTTRLDYRVRQPLKPTANPQVLFLLHGYGSHEEDLFSFANYLPEDYLIISLRAPLSLSFGGYAWYSCLLYTSPSPRDLSTSRMPSSA